MKVLHVVPSYLPAFRYGGPIVSVHELNKALVEAGHQVTVFTTDADGEGSLTVRKNTPVHLDGVEVWYFPRSFPKRWFYSRALHQALKEKMREFEVVHITSVFLAASTLGAYYAKKFGRPYIISPRGSLMREPLTQKGPLKKRIYWSLVERRNFVDAAAVHATTEAERDEYLTAGFPARRMAVVPNGLTPLPSSRDAAAFRARHRIASAAPLVLFLSRISWKKGLDTLIPAFAEVLKVVPDAILTIAGGDDEGYGKVVKQLIADSKLQNYVILVGALSRAEVADAYAAADVYTLPSYAENFGNTVLEAASCGVPVVVTPEVGVAPWIAGQGAGMVVPKDITAVSRAITGILTDRATAQAMGARGKTLTESSFSWRRVAAQFSGLYNELVAA